MNIHKIDSTLKEHQNFLAQNRQDPITGDSILENDEVVFCAGCKSVFLKDTWEYLAKQHCEQTETLIEFPISSKEIYLKTKAELLFYTYLHSKNGFTDSIPVTNKSIWKYIGRKLSSNHELFNDLFYLIVLLCIGGGIALIVQTDKVAFILLSIFSTVFLFWLRYYLNDENKKKLNTFHKDFSDNVFYISDKNIGFSTSDGIEEYVLDFRLVESLYFSFIHPNSFSSKAGNCSIIDKNNKETLFRIDYFDVKTNDSFLKTIYFLNQNYDIKINIKTSDIKNRDELNAFLSRMDIKKETINFSFVEYEE
jgi:hypothetical protein